MMTTYPHQCINCDYLGHCSETDADKIIAGYSCDRWKEGKPEICAARIHIITLFGKQGAKAVLQKDLKEED